MHAISPSLTHSVTFSGDTVADLGLEAPHLKLASVRHLGIEHVVFARVVWILHDLEGGVGHKGRKSRARASQKLVGRTNR